MTKTNPARSHFLINTKTKQPQSKPMSRTLADTMAAQLNEIMGAGVIVVVPAGWQGVGLN